MGIMAKPIIHAIIFGAIIGGCFYPLFNKVMMVTKWKREVVAGLVSSLVVFLLFIPIIYLAFSLSRESFNLYQTLKSMVLANDQSIFESNFIGSFVVKIANIFQVDITLDLIKSKAIEFLQQFSTYVLNTVNSWISNILSFLFDFCIMVVIIYVLFAEGPDFKEYMLKLSPLPDDQEEVIIKKFNQMNYVTLVCNGVGGVIQGGIAGLAFWIAGVPSVLLWSVTMVLLAFIPLVGISIVYIPVSIYLAIKGKVLAAVLLFIFCTIVAFVVENWFKPKFIGNRIKVNSFFVLFCIIGGMGSFGMAGIFYGPIIGIIFLTTAELYHANYAPEAEMVESEINRAED